MAVAIGRREQLLRGQLVFALDLVRMRNSPRPALGDRPSRGQGGTARRSLHGGMLPQPYEDPTGFAADSNYGGTSAAGLCNEAAITLAKAASIWKIANPAPTPISTKNSAHGCSDAQMSTVLKTVAGRQGRQPSAVSGSLAAGVLAHLQAFEDDADTVIEATRRLLHVIWHPPFTADLL